MSNLTIHTTVDIHTDADTAWQVFGTDFGSWADWAPGIDTSTMNGPVQQGAIRVNETPTLGTVEQRLSHFDPATRALTYEMHGRLPPVFTSVRNEWVIEPVDGTHCQLVGTAHFALTETAEPMKPQLEGKMGMALEVFAEAFRKHMAAQ